MKNSKKFILIISSMIPSIFKNIYLMIKYKCIIHPCANIFFLNNLKIGKGAYLGRCDILAQGPISIGKNCIINDYVILNSKTGYINIGDGSSVNSFSVIYGNGGVEIGKNNAIAQAVKIVKNHKIPKYKHEGYVKLSEKKTIIGDNVWLCANVVVVDGVKIGSFSVIGANSLVSRDVPESVIAAGNPAKVLRKIKYK
ncbi:MAG: hypothetical protein WC393_00855 [Candidatus Nanoarchaeia archaeon]|jgi:acetyltransferase-like isoleucine patch superfamily enzyme